MTNHPNRKPERHPSCEGVSIAIERIAHNIIEYTLSDANGQWSFHANREATFHGPHGGSARQVHGVASTLWRERDDDMIKAFERRYPHAEISIT